MWQSVSDWASRRRWRAPKRKRYLWSYSRATKNHPTDSTNWIIVGQELVFKTETCVCVCVYFKQSSCPTVTELCCSVGVTGRDRRSPDAERERERVERFPKENHNTTHISPYRICNFSPKSQNLPVPCVCGVCVVRKNPLYNAAFLLRIHGPKNCGVYVWVCPAHATMEL